MGERVCRGRLPSDRQLTIARVVSLALGARGLTQPLVQDVLLQTFGGLMRSNEVDVARQFSRSASQRFQGGCWGSALLCFRPPSQQHVTNRAVFFFRRCSVGHATPRCFLDIREAEGSEGSVEGEGEDEGRQSSPPIGAHIGAPAASTPPRWAVARRLAPCGRGRLERCVQAPPCEH
jgi:hypothetical protein